MLDSTGVLEQRDLCTWETSTVHLQSMDCGLCYPLRQLRIYTFQVRETNYGILDLVVYPELVSRGVSKSRKLKWLVKVGASKGVITLI